jgi:thiamine biosynthesis lipoprotein ApbE
MKKARSFLFSLSIILAATLPATKAHPDQTRQFSYRHLLTGGIAMEITIIAMESDKKRADDAAMQAISKISALDAELFSHGGISEKLNSLGKGERLKVPPEIFTMLSKAAELSHQTDGFYDVAAPSPKGMFIQRDWRRIVFDEGNFTVNYKSDDMKLDLNKIAPAFFTDLIADGLLASGLTSFMISTGNVCRYHGRDIFTPWSLQIGFGTGELSGYAKRAWNFSLNNSSAATITSSSIGDGFIDGRNKMPISPGSMQSVTILANDAMTAGAFAFAVYALGPKHGMRYIEAHPAIKGIMVDNSGALVASAGLNLSNPNLKSNWPESTGPEQGPMNLKQKKTEEEQDL